MKNQNNILAFIFIVLMVPYASAQSPLRIVSLAPSLTKMLYLLDAQKQLVGCTSYCEEGIKDHKSVVASAIEVNIEKVYLLKPDLVVTTTLTKQATLDALKKVGIRVNVLPMPNSYDEICSQLVEMAKLTGKLALANNVIKTQQQRLRLLRQKIPKGIKPRVFFEIGANPLFTVIPNTFMDDYITYSGGENIASDFKIGTISRESVLLRNPDVIFIVTMGIVGSEEKETWNNYPNMKASKSRKVFIIDSYKACSPNPVSFVDIVEQLISLMYK